MRRGSSGKIEAKKGLRIPKGEKLANQKAEALGAVTLKGITIEPKIIHRIRKYSDRIIAVCRRFHSFCLALF